MQKYKSKNQLSQCVSATPNVHSVYTSLHLGASPNVQNKENCATLRKFQRQLFCKNKNPAKRGQNLSLSSLHSVPHKGRAVHQIRVSSLERNDESSSDAGYGGNSQQMHSAVNRNETIRQSLSSF